LSSQFVHVGYVCYVYFNKDQSRSINPGTQPVPECLHSGFYRSWGWRKWWEQVEL